MHAGSLRDWWRGVIPSQNTPPVAAAAYRLHGHAMQCSCRRCRWPSHLGPVIVASLPWIRNTSGLRWPHRDRHPIFSRRFPASAGRLLRHRSDPKVGQPKELFLFPIQLETIFPAVSGKDPGDLPVNKVKVKA